MIASHTRVGGFSNAPHYPKGLAPRPPRQAWPAALLGRILRSIESVPEVARVTETAAILFSDPWLTLRPDSSTGYSNAASERLVRALEAYASAEARDLSDCEDLARRSDEPGVRVLLGLIVEDERRHQTLLESMVSCLQAETPVKRTASVPHIAKSEPLPDVELAATLRRLIRDAHEGARHLRHVGRLEEPVYDGLYTMLLEAIARDSEKHATIFRYLLTRVERRSS
jgi:rubrerythrin